jgi:hypothetical protein
MVVAQDGPAHERPHWRGGNALRKARTCYDHMAGRLAVRIAERLIERSHIVLAEDGGCVTAAGRAFLESIGVDLSSPPRRRIFCRPCLDWSERRPHLAGFVGAALLRYAFDRSWIKRVKGSRALAITPAGEQGFAKTFGIVVDDNLSGPSQRHAGLKISAKPNVCLAAQVLSSRQTGKLVVTTAGPFPLGAALGASSRSVTNRSTPN